MQSGVYSLPCDGWALGYLPTYLVLFCFVFFGFGSSSEKTSQRDYGRICIKGQNGLTFLCLVFRG